MGPRSSQAFALGVLAALALTVPWGCSAPPPRTARVAPSAPPVDPDAMASALVEAHNRARTARGLPELVVNPQLEAAARKHAEDMAARHRMAHRGSDGSSPFRRMKGESYRFVRAGENVAMGQPTLDVLMRDWMRSPGHRRNILGNFTEIGAAGATDTNGTPYWCVTFGTPIAR